MAKPFAEWTIDDANEAISKAIAEQVSKDGFDANRKFVEERDHWQDGNGWMGPLGDDSRRAEVLAAIKRQFTPRDTIGEVLDRMANALLKRAFHVDLIPLKPIEEPELEPGLDEEEKARRLAAYEELVAQQEEEIEELTSTIMTWARRRRLSAKIRKAVKRARWATRGALRVWIPQGRLVESGESTTLPTAATVAEALDFLEIDAPPPDVAMVYRDDETAETAAIFLFKDESKERCEFWYNEGDDAVLRILTSDEKQTDETYRVPLGGRIPIAEMGADLLITDAVRRQQHRLNFFESLIVRVGETAGFPERYTLNAEPNGIWSKALPLNGPPLDTQIQDGETWYLHPVHRTLGASITTELVGIVEKGPEGEKRASPGVEFKDPTDPQYATKVTDHAYHAILNECKQEHIALQRTGEASGTAYQQARADFDADVNAVRVDLEELIRKNLEAALAWADHMATEANILERYRLGVRLSVTSGPVTNEEQEQHNANVKAGTLSRPSAMAANGVEDVDAEIIRIDGEPSAIVELRTKQVTMIRELLGDGSDGMTWERAARIAGVDDEEILEQLRSADKEAQDVEDEESAQDDEIRNILEGTGAAAA